MLDLYHATRDELIQITLLQREALAERDRRIAALETTLTQQQAVIAQLTAQVGTLLAHQTGPEDDPPSGAVQGMPGVKPQQTPEREARPRKPRAHGAGRHRMEATAQVIHALAHCPDCGAPLAGGSVKRTREVIDLPIPQVVVTKHVYLERRCPDCGKRCVPAPATADVAAGQHRLGHGLVSLIAVLREQARLPFAIMQGLLQTLTGLHLSVGALVDATVLVARRATSTMTAIREAVRASPVVHADETGWREAGRNGYVWTFSTPDQRLFQHGSRAKAMVGQVLGDAFAGVVVSDFYTAYTGDDRVHQYCWAHLLRDIHDLTEQHPDDAAVQGWAQAVHTIFARAQAGATGDQAARWRRRKQVETDLRHVCEPWREPKAAQTTLCVRILRHLESLFVFVTDPTVPATNNAAERSLRPLVVSRKISGGTRSAQGTLTKMTLASLFGTWRAQGRNPFAECQTLLASPQL